MGFIQEGPQLAHPLRHDRVLRGWLRQTFDVGTLDTLDPSLAALAGYAAEAYARRLESPRREPVFTPWDAWGRRVDRIELTPAWEEGPALTTRHGLLWRGHEHDVSGLHRAAHARDAARLAGAVAFTRACLSRLA